MHKSRTRPTDWPWARDDSLLWARIVAWLIDAALLAPLLCTGLGWILATIAYHGVLEGVWGTTLGKGLMGLRVIRWDGQVPGLGRGLARSLCRFVEVNPILVLNARTNGLLWIVLKHVSSSPGSQRPGGRMTRTFVVRTNQVVRLRSATSALSWT